MIISERMHTIFYSIDRYYVNLYINNSLKKKSEPVVCLSSMPSLMTASCCFTRTSRGTPSDLVQPPRGDSHRMGLL